MSIGGSELSVAARAIGAVRRLLRRPDPAAVLRRQAKVKKELRRKAFKKKYVEEYESYRTFHVIRVGKLKAYPDTDKRRVPWGKPHWFEIHIWRLDRRGLLVDLGDAPFIVSRGKARRAIGEEWKSGVWLQMAGVIPYESIEHIEWSPSYEPYYTRPRFHVYYSPIRKSPFREVILYERSGYSGLYSELTGIKYRGYGSRERLKRFVETAKKTSRSRRLSRTSRKVTEEFLGK
jgi:hypothetical protein